MVLRGSSATLIRLLIWTNVTFLVAVLLFLKHDIGRSAPFKLERNGVSTATLDDAQPQGSPSLTSLSSRSQQELQAQRKLFSQSKILWHEQQGFEEDRNSPSQPHRSLCQRSPQQLPKFLSFVRLVQCSRKEASDDLRKMSRRFLTGSIEIPNEEPAEAEAKPTFGEKSRDRAAFQVDYSGPETHPPKNN